VTGSLYIGSKIVSAALAGSRRAALAHPPADRIVPLMPPTLIPPSMRLPRPGAALAYDSVGSGDRAPILHAHGMLLSRAAEARLDLVDWSPIAAAGRRHVRYDARAHGDSSGRPHPDDYLWPALAQDLLALAEAISPDRPVDGIGASLGTATLIWAALQAPARLRRLVLTIPPTAWQTRVAQGAVYRAAADLIEREGAGAWLAGLQKLATPPIFGDLPSYSFTPDVAEPLLPSVLRGAARSDLPSPEELRALRQPTLILAWDTDPSHPVSTAETLAALLPHAELQVARTSAEVRGWGARAAAFLGR
jgi:3-oxoadipate enol-lactonase